MTTHNTGNALGSSDARDLYDNAENIDNFANGAANTYQDRLGVTRKSLAGMNNAFDDFIESSGYTVPVAYTSGIVLTEYNQLIEYNDEFYKLKAGQAPYTTIGTWGADSAKLVSVGDAALRQELAAADGADRVGYGAGTVQDALDERLPEVANYAAVRAGLGGLPAVYVRGRANVFDGGAGVFLLKAGDTTTADNGGTVLVDVVSGARYVRDIASGVDVQWFESVSADGSAAMQAAVNEWDANPNLEIVNSGEVVLTASVEIPNKETDNPERRLIIRGGSIKKTTLGHMFTKKAGQALPDLTPLQTGHVTFDSVRFLGPRSTSGTYIIDGDNVIRTKFVNCYGDGVQIAYAAGYLQSIYVDSASVFRKWSGWLFDCGYLYDVKFYGTAEAGQSFMRTRDSTADPAANSLAVRGCIEGLTGKVFELGVCFGVVIDGNYQEQNAGGDYDFSAGAGYHKGLTLIGNGFQPSSAQLADPNYYPVKLGKGAQNSIVLIGNSSTGNLFDISASNESAIVDSGNWCAGTKFSRTTREFSFDNGLEARYRIVDGLGVGAHSYYQKFGFESTRTTVGGESVTAGITVGNANPQMMPSAYPQKNWVKGTVIYATNVGIDYRTYGGVPRLALILGWVCLESGTPGVWREIAVMLDY